MSVDKDVGEVRLTLLNAREAAVYLRVSLFTLSRIEKEGGLVPFRTPGGHRRYSLQMLNKYLENSRGWERKPRIGEVPVPKKVER